VQYDRKDSLSGCSPNSCKKLEMDNPKQLQKDEDHDDHDQNVDPTADFREPRADVPAEEAEQPENDEHYDDGPQHGDPPLEYLDGRHRAFQPDGTEVTGSAG
jgi:hypothetical protein